MRSLTIAVMTCLAVAVFASLAVADTPDAVDQDQTTLPPQLSANQPVRVVALVSKDTFSVVAPEKYDEVFENDLPAGATLLMCDALTMQATGGERHGIAVKAHGNVALQGDRFAARCEEVSFRDQRIAMTGDPVELGKIEPESEQPSFTLTASRVVFYPTSGHIHVDGATTIDGLLHGAERPR